MNKRDFILGACVTLTAGMGHATATACGASPSAMAGRLARWPDLAAGGGAQTWQNYVGETFVHAHVAAGFTLVLRAVDVHAAPGGGEQFTLIFTAGTGPAVQATLLHLRHAATGQQIALFVQGAGTDPAGTALARAEHQHLG